MSDDEWWWMMTNDDVVNVALDAWASECYLGWAVKMMTQHWFNFFLKEMILRMKPNGGMILGIIWHIEENIWMNVSHEGVLFLYKEVASCQGERIMKGIRKSFAVRGECINEWKGSRSLSKRMHQGPLLLSGLLPLSSIWGTATQGAVSISWAIVLLGNCF